MAVYTYTIRELQWHEESRSIPANSLAEAKAKVAEDIYHIDSTVEDTECFAGDYKVGEAIPEGYLEPQWDVIDEPEHYPVIILCKEHMFTAAGPRDLIEMSHSNFYNPINDFRCYATGKKTRFTYIKPQKLAQLKENTNE